MTARLPLAVTLAAIGAPLVAPTYAQAATPDTLVVSADGTHYIQTGFDGQLRATISMSPPGAPYGLALRQPAPIPLVAPLPSRVMLDELGFVTPAKDQGQRGSCTIFSTVGAIESEYLRQRGVSLDLSEEYVINMMNEARAPGWTNGPIGDKLYVESYYGVPPTSTWPYQPYQWTVDGAVCTAFGIAPRTDACLWQNDIGNQQGVWYGVNRDVANYAPLVYPPYTTHAAASYGPAYAAVSPVAWSGSDATPFESLIAAGHPVAFGTELGYWKLQPDGTYDLDPNGKNEFGHSMLLVGYDHDKRLFRIKNSFSTQWGKNGLADASYTVFLSHLGDPNWITSIKNPSVDPGGVGVFRGFYRAILGGKSGVVVIHHAFDDVGMTSTVSADAGIFYRDDGQTQPLEWGGLDGPEGIFLLKQGSTVVESIYLTPSPTGPWRFSGRNNVTGAAVGGQWCRTSAQSVAGNLHPAGYGDAPTDPSAFPDVACTPAERQAIFTCPTCRQ